MLDSKQKRGSAMNPKMPFRKWISEPDGTDSTDNRLSFVRMYARITVVADLTTYIINKVWSFLSKKKDWRFEARPKNWTFNNRNKDWRF